MTTVALIRCTTYTPDAVKAAVDRGMDLLGGAARFVDRGETILLKPNILAADPPEKCVTTHPAVFKAVAESLRHAGAQLCYGDSPAFGNVAAATRKSGLEAVARQLDIALADFKSGRPVLFEDGFQKRNFTIANGVMAADGLISLPKLKTHGLERITGCVKNQFGCIPGFLKGECHVKLPDAEAFAKLLVDLNLLIRPRLYVMDGIHAMEGNGPRGGVPRPMNLLLFSTDPVALDATVCRLIGLDPAYVPTITYGQLCGMGSFAQDRIQLVGDDPSQFKSADFDVVRRPIKPFKQRRLQRFLSNRLVAKPVIVAEKCVRCGMCVHICPARPKAVNWRNGDQTRPPVYDYGVCIRCYCCQELCPQSAIRLKTPPLRRIADVFLT